MRKSASEFEVKQVLSLANAARYTLKRSIETSTSRDASSEWFEIAKRFLEELDNDIQTLSDHIAFERQCSVDYPKGLRPKVYRKNGKLRVSSVSLECELFDKKQHGSVQWKSVNYLPYTWAELTVLYAALQEINQVFNHYLKDRDARRNFFVHRQVNPFSGSIWRPAPGGYKIIKH